MKVDLGSGGKVPEGYDSVDIDPNTNPDHCLDISREQLPFEDNSVEEVRACHVLEHLPKERSLFLFREVHRVLEPNGTFYIILPPFPHPLAIADPTHLSFWNIESFDYFNVDSTLYHEFAHYHDAPPFRVTRFEQGGITSCDSWMLYVWMIPVKNKRDIPPPPIRPRGLMHSLR